MPWFFGPGYDKVIILMNIITPIILLMGIANILGSQFLLPTKRQKEFFLSVLVGIIINFILNYIMIKLWNSIGACIATVLSEIVVIAMQMYYVKKEIDLKQMLKLSYRYLFAGAIMFVITIGIQYILSGMLCVVVQIIVGIVIYFGILIMLKDEFVYLLFDKIKSKGFNKLNAK